MNSTVCTSGAFMLYRRDVLEAVGGFSPHFSCEDIELTFRVHEHFLRQRVPYRILAVPEPVARTDGARPDQQPDVAARSLAASDAGDGVFWGAHPRGRRLLPRRHSTGSVSAAT